MPHPLGAYNGMNVGNQIGPFVPLIVEEPDKVAADDASGLEPDLMTIGGLMPVGQGNPVGTIRHKIIDRIYKSLKVFMFICQGGCPQYPVRFGIGSAAVEGQAKGIKVLQVPGDLLLVYLGREEAQIEELIP